MEDKGKNPGDPPIPLPPALSSDPPPANGAPLRERVASVPLPVANDKVTTTPGGRVLAQAPVPGGKDKEKTAPPEPKDGTREIIDTFVIVVVLVLLLKSFLAEAFVIPTGSMATTLLGYHKQITCPDCGHQFELNLSKQVDAAEEHPQQITGCRCENCQAHIILPHDQAAPKKQLEP